MVEEGSAAEVSCQPSSSSTGGGLDDGFRSEAVIEPSDDTDAGAGTDGVTGARGDCDNKDSPFGGGLLTHGAAIPISVVCLGGRTDPDLTALASRADSDPSADGLGSGGFGALSPAQAVGSFEA